MKPSDSMGKLSGIGDKVLIAFYRRRKRLTIAELVVILKEKDDNRVRKAVAELVFFRLVKKCQVKGRYAGREREQYEVYDAVS